MSCHEFSGSWFAVVCLVGLVVPFRNRSLRRLRFFLLMTLAVFALSQALGRTHLSAANGTLAELLARSLGQGAPVNAASGVNGENLLSILGPVSFLFGAGLFFFAAGPVESRPAGNAFGCFHRLGRGRHASDGLELPAAALFVSPWLILPYHPARCAVPVSSRSG